MPARPARILSALILTLAVAAPATATHGGIHPTVKAERTYFHCTGPTKVQNVNLVVSGPPSWNTTPPPGSFQAGNGCGALDTTLRGGNTATIYDAVFRGTYTGNIRDMTLELHNLLLSRARQTATFAVRVRMLVDGTAIFPETVGVVVNVTPTLSSTGVSEKFLISIPNLGCSREVFDAEGKLIDVVTDGLISEDGDGTTSRTIAIAIDSPTQTSASAWVWDATEIPSGITFNPTDALAAAKANPTDPASCG